MENRGPEGLDPPSVPQLRPAARQRLDPRAFPWTGHLGQATEDLCLLLGRGQEKKKLSAPC